MHRQTCCVAFGLLLLGAASAQGEILRGFMGIKGAEMP